MRVKIRGKSHSFKSRVLKSGVTAYYRDGKRAKTRYQIRLARGILAGKSPQASVGKVDLQSKLISAEEIRDTAGQHPKSPQYDLSSWAESLTSKPKPDTRYDYYALVNVTSKSLEEIGSGKGDGEKCASATLKLSDPKSNNQIGFSQRDFKRRFASIMRHTLKKYRLKLCTGSLDRDLLRVWRHGKEK